MIPTLKQVMTCYKLISQAERMKTGRPSSETVANVLRGCTNICRAAGISEETCVAAITRKTFDAALTNFMERKLSRISALSYLYQFKALFARWCQPYYSDMNWEIPPFELPSFRAMITRYVRPSPELLARVKAWYAGLTDAKWFAATMMLEFAMRNGDVLRLREENLVTRAFPAAAVHHYLSYTPHKTALTSGRRVYWPIHPDIWTTYVALGGLTRLNLTTETFVTLNRELRQVGFHGSKATYELRKICIDHIYQRYGAEMAVSISGDDIRTISRYYADPAQPNIGNVRVLDLL